MTGDGARATARDFPMPDILAESARSWLRVGGQQAVAPARPSSTVMLLREAPDLQVFVLHRVASMPFAPGMLAFPGGGVDPRDADPTVRWSGLTAEQWAGRLGVPSDIARELVTAAAREVFEECGVLLAGPGPDSVVADLTDPQWDLERQALLVREQSFAELLQRRDLTLRADLLQLRAHWVTPECEPRRYDTRFFAARMPTGQVADDRSSEASTARWSRPADLLGEASQGTVSMLPPTRVMLEQLAAAGAVDAVMGGSPQVHVVMPRPVEAHGALWMRAPIDDEGNGLPPAPVGR